VAAAVKHHQEEAEEAEVEEEEKEEEEGEEAEVEVEGVDLYLPGGARKSGEVREESEECERELVRTLAENVVSKQQLVAEGHHFARSLPERKQLQCMCA
jgi:hypothetical protein